MEKQNNSESAPSAMATAQRIPLSWMTEKGLVKLRPRGLKSVTMLLCTESILWLGYITHAQRSSTVEIAALLLARVIGFWIIWYFWKGRNWARLLNLVSATSIFIPFFPPKHIPVMQFYMVVDSVFSAYLLYWLNTKPVARFFKASGNDVSNVV